MANEEAYLQVQTTVDDPELARELAAALVDEGLAACVQILGPVESHYRWQGRREVAREWLLVAKTDQRRYPRLAEAIGRRHPYEVPEVVAVPLVEMADGYRAWLGDSLR
jgi:periplasmic divalent cation tolerance protein